LARGETPVGCVLVHRGEIIGAGMNDTNASMNVGDIPDTFFDFVSEAFSLKV
jgi:deoxycytidylate deaminase